MPKNFVFKMVKTDFVFLFEKAMVEAAKAPATKSQYEALLAAWVAGTTGLTASVNWTTMILSVNWTGSAKTFTLSMTSVNWTALATWTALACTNADLQAKAMSIFGIVDDGASGVATSVNWTVSPYAVSVNWT